MDKDNDLKKDHSYQSSHLRQKINESIKRIRDTTDEVKNSQAKPLSSRKRDKRSKNGWNKNDL